MYKNQEEKPPGRVNFENVLERDLDRANEFYRNGQFEKFMLATQQIWQNCLEDDRDAILELVEETVEAEIEESEDGRNRQRVFRRQLRGVNEDLEDRREFLQFVEASPHYTFGRSKFKDKNIGKWRRVFTILNNGLKKRYYGGKEKLY